MFPARVISRFAFRTLTAANRVRAPVRNYVMSSITTKDGPYRIVLNLSMFSLEEIKVKTGQITTISVEALQKTEDDKGLSSNYISMKYAVPMTHNGDALDAKLDSGLLVLTAPKVKGDLESLYRHIKVRT